MRITRKILTFFIAVVFLFSNKIYADEIDALRNRVKSGVKETRQELQEKRKEQQILAIFAQAKRLYEQGKPEEANKLYKKIARMTDDKYMVEYEKRRQQELAEEIRLEREQEQAKLRAEQDKLKRIKTERKAKARKLEQKAKGLYVEALGLYKVKKFEAAADKFKQVEQVIPNYKWTRYYIDRIPEEIQLEAERKEAEIKRREEQARLERERLVREERARQQRTMEKKERQKELERQKIVDEQRLRKEQQQRQIEAKAKLLYDEGILLFRAKDFERAQEKFRQASQVVPGFLNTEYYLNRLPGDIEAERMRRKREKQKMEWGKKRTEEIKVIAQQAANLEEQGRMEDANKLYEKAERLLNDPQFKEYAKAKKEKEKNAKLFAKKQKVEEKVWLENQKRVEGMLLEKRAAELYAEGIALYETRNYREAQVKFSQVEQFIPDYLKTRKYMNKISKVIQIDSTKTIKSYTPGKDKAKKQKGIRTKKSATVKTRAVDVKDKSTAEVKQVSPKKLDKAQRREIKKQGKERKRKAKKIYREAVTLYKARDLKAAQEKFMELEKIIPAYRKTRYYLNRMPKDMEKYQATRKTKGGKVQKKDDIEHKKKVFRSVKDKRKAADALYNEALGLYKAKRYKKAKTKFEEVESIIPNYSWTRYYLKRMSQEAKGKKAPEKTIKPTKKEDWNTKARKKGPASPKEAKRAKKLYNEAIKLYRARKFAAAQDKFGRVEKLLPDYSWTRYYLKRLPEDMQQEKDRMQTKRKQTRSGGSKEQQLQRKIQKTQEERVARKQAEAKRRQRLLEKREEKRKNKQQAKVLYSEAVSLYKGKYYLAAQEKFKRVERLVSDFKWTGYYLNRIPDDIEQEKKRLESERKRQEAKEKREAEYNLRQQRIRREKESREAEKHRDILRDQQEEEQLRLIQEEKEAKEFKIKEKAVALYNESLDLYEKNQYDAAADTFKAAQAIDPVYPQTRLYLARLSENIQRAKRREKEEKQYEKLVKQQEIKLKKKEERRKEISREKEEELQNRRDRIQRQKRKEEEAKQQAKRNKKQAKVLYDQAISLYNAEKYEGALVKFEHIENLVPDFAWTRYYLDRLPEDIKAHNQTVSTENRVRGQLTYQDMQRQKKAAWITQQKEIRKQARLMEKQEETARKRQEQQQELKRKHLEKQLKGAYDNTVALYDNEQYRTAYNQFQQIEQVLPDYKWTRYYLKKLPQDIENQNKEMAAEKELESKLDTRKKQKEEQRQKLESWKKEKEIDRKKQQEIRRQLMEEKIKLAAEREGKMKKLAMKADGIYQEAQALYSAKNYSEAQEKFLTLEKLLPGYKKTRGYLSKITRKMYRQTERQAIAEAQNEKVRYRQRSKKTHRESLREWKEEKQSIRSKKEMEHRQKMGELSEIYKQAVILYKNGNYEEAKNRFIELEKRSPDYKRTRRYLDGISGRIRKQDQKELVGRQKREQRQRKRSMRDRESRLIREEKDRKRRLKEEKRRLSQQLNSLYNEGRVLYKSGEYEGAREKFIQIEAIQPGYAGTRDYINRIENNLRNKEKEVSNIRKRRKDLDNMIKKRNRRENVVDSIKSKWRTAKILYDEAVTLYEERNYANAQRKFKQVEQLIPDYSKTRYYINRIAQQK